MRASDVFAAPDAASRRSKPPLAQDRKGEDRLSCRFRTICEKWPRLFKIMHVFGSVMAGIPRLPLFRIVLCRNIHSAQPAAAMIPPASAYPAPVRIAPFPPCRNNTSPSQATCSVSPFANSTSTVSPRRLCSSRRAYSCASQSSTYAPLSARRRQSASLPSASAKAYTSSSTPVIVAFALSMGCRASVTASMSSLAAIIKHAASRNPIKNAPSDPGERSASRRSSVMPRNPAANFPNRMVFPFPAFDSLTQLPETAFSDGENCSSIR